MRIAENEGVTARYGLSQRSDKPNQRGRWLGLDKLNRRGGVNKLNQREPAWGLLRVVLSRLQVLLAATHADCRERGSGWARPTASGASTSTSVHPAFTVLRRSLHLARLVSGRPNTRILRRHDVKRTSLRTAALPAVAALAMGLSLSAC